MVTLLSEAQHAVGLLGGLARSVENPHLLIRPFLDREAVLSSQIEGTQTTYKELVLSKGSEEESRGDVQEVANYVRALDQGLERLEQLPVSLRLIKELHGTLLAGVRGQERTPGEFRRSQNWIGKPGCTLAEAAFVPPAPELLMETLDAFEKYIYSDHAAPKLVQLALIHYQFETIHPFLDGNGRLGRLLIVLLTCQWGLLPSPLLYLSAFFHQHRQAYYEGLQQVRTHGRWDEWIAFFLRGIRAQANDSVERATKLQEARLDFERRTRGYRSSGALHHLLDKLFAFPLLTIPKAAKILGMSYRAAQLNVEKLVAEKILWEAPGSYPKTFYCPQILEIVSPETETEQS